MPRDFGVPSNDDQADFGPQRIFGPRRIFNAIAYSLIAAVLAAGIVAMIASSLVLLKVLAP